MSNSSDILVQVKNLSRYYGNLCAVNNLNFEIKRGEVLGLLGPNGAGKSTTMQMISGNLAPTNGEIIVNQLDILDHPKQAKLNMGYLPEKPPLYNDLTVDEYLKFCARLKKIPHAKQVEALKETKLRCGLADVGNRLIANLSKGYQQRVGIAQAIIHSPAVIILDEPTVGLDPIQIREIRSLIKELGGNHSVILSTHILPEVTATCDRVLIINNGKLVLTESSSGLKKKMESSSLIVSFKQPPTIDELKNFPGVDNIEVISPFRFRLHHNPNIDPAEEIVLSSVKNNWRLVEVSPEQLSLEEIFVDITTSENVNKPTEGVTI